MNEIVAIIPARGGSKGISRKNLQLVDGIPLVALSILQAKESKKIKRIFVSTEDEEIAHTARKYGAEVLGRIENFIHDNSFMEVDRLLKWSVEKMIEQKVPVDILVMLYPTSPLRTVESIDQTIAKVADEGYDSALTLFEDPKYLWKTADDGTAVPTNYDPKNRGPRQKEDWNQWAENKAVYAMTRQLIQETGCRLGGKTGFVVMNTWDSVDVDNPEDLEMVRVIYQARKRIK